MTRSTCKNLYIGDDGEEYCAHGCITFCDECSAWEPCPQEVSE